MSRVRARSGTFFIYGRVCLVAPKMVLFCEQKFTRYTQNGILSLQNPKWYSTMTSRTNRDTSSAIVHAVCACAPAADMICSCAIRAIGWVCPFLAHDHCLGSGYFWRAYCLSYESFLFLHEKLSIGIVKAVDNARFYERRGGGEGRQL